jgi:hypothetical protein
MFGLKFKERVGTMFDPGKFLETMFMAAAGIGVMFAVPMLASKYKGGLQLLAICGAITLYYMYDEGYFGY